MRELIIGILLLTCLGLTTLTNNSFLNLIGASGGLMLLFFSAPQKRTRMKKLSNTIKRK